VPSRGTAPSPSPLPRAGISDQGQAEEWQRLLIRGGSRMAADAADRAGGKEELRKRMLRRNLARACINKACMDTMPQVAREAITGDSVAMKIHTDMRKTVVATRGDQTKAGRTARMVASKGAPFLPRIVTFIRRKTISDHTCAIAERGSSLASLRRWRSLTKPRQVVEKKAEKEPAPTSDMLATLDKQACDPFDSSWERIMSRHTLLAPTLPDKLCAELTCRAPYQRQRRISLRSRCPNSNLYSTLSQQVCA